MLQLITGTAGTGKSVWIKQKIRENAAAGRKSTLIVPEQYSKTAESEVFSMLEKSSFGLVNVYSFTSLLRDVNTEKGIANAPALTDAGKAVIAKKSMQNVYKQLGSYQKQKNNTDFAFKLVRIFEDFKRNGIDSVRLFEAAERAPQINSKLKDISNIYSEYCANMRFAGADLEEMYLQLSQNLPVSYTDETDFFVDGFESFTHGQYAVLSRIMEKSHDVYVALTAQEVFDRWGGTHPLSYTADTAAKLIQCAKKCGAGAASAVKLQTQHRFLNNTLKNIDKFLLSRPLVPDGEGDGAFVTVFPGQFDEVSFTAAQIHKLCRQGYSYDDIAVVCPQLEKYEHQLQESFSLAQIPYFIDQNRIILSSAPVVLFKSIMEIMDRGLNGDTVLPLLKTELTCFDSEAADMLENYLFIWQDQDIDFYGGFDLPYSGMNRQSEDDAQNLARINELAEGLCRIFPRADTAQQRPASELLENLYDILDMLGSEDIMEGIIDASANKEQADLLLRQWECAVDCLQELYNICGGMVMRPRELQELFMLMIEGSEIGFAPQTQDCVIISTPPRMKIDAVKAVFVLGASQDIFPSLISDSGILSAADVQYLKDNQMELSADFTQRFAFENLYFYKTLTTAREKLYISCADRNIDSREIVSAEIEGIKSALGLSAAQLKVEDYCITPQFFTQYIGERYGTDGVQILEKMGFEVPALAQRRFVINNTENIEKLLGEHMVISPTAAESYYRCAFGYLMGNLMKIRPMEKAQVTQREAGNYLHTVAQQVVERYGESYGATPWEEIEGYTAEVVQRYLEQNYPEKIRKSARFDALSRDMHGNVRQLLKYIHSEQQSASFHPAAFEVPIAFNSPLKPVTVQLDNGKKISIVGVCDRIDVMHSEGKDYIRVVDYKTGTKKFSLEDVYNGLSCQLLLYMSSALKSNMFGDNPVAAAVMYQPSDAAFKFDSHESLYSPVGMALESAAVSAGFDKDCSGSFGVIKGEDKIKSLAGSEVVDEKLFDAVLDCSKDKIKQMAEDVYAGMFDNEPLDQGGEKTACPYCGYRIICRETDRMKPRKKAQFTIKKEEDENG